VNIQATLITATNRLAEERQQHHDQQQLAAGLRTWPSLDVLSWNSWVKRLWQDQPATSARYLSPLEQQQLWADIIEQDVAQQKSKSEANLAPLWNFQAAAKQAIQAWQLLKLWDINLDRCRFSSQSDHRSFARWAERYGAKLSQNGWVDDASMVCFLSQQPPQIETPIELHGFEEFSPAQQRLLDALKANKSQVKIIPSLQANPTPPTLQAFSDIEREWQHIAAWVRDILKLYPEARIGIVTPELESQRHSVISALNAQLSPGCIQADIDPPAYHLSVGTPLRRQPLVQAALEVIDLTGPIEFDGVSNALTSPYAFTQTQPTARYALEQAMRQSVPYQLDLYHCLRAVEQHNPALPDLRQALTAMQAQKKATPITQHYSQWAQFFADWLQQAQWPGAKLNSADHQALEAWRNALHQLSQLDHLGHPVRLSEARADLKRLCQQTRFQPQANPDTPIQVLGMLEASGLQFDYLWVAGLHDKAWPSPAQANPFIPISAQREAGWPAANAQRHLALAEQRLTQLLGAAKEVHLSYAQTVEEVTTTPSALIPSNVTPANTHPSPLDWPHHLCTQPIQFEQLDDHQAPALATDRVDRGINRIEDQSACPFRAFARYRLKAQFEDEPEPGTDALDRGSLVHAVLADYWQQTRTQALLQTHIEQNQLTTILQPIIDQHLVKAVRNSGLGDPFARAEAARVSCLIQNWLAIELQRTPFTVIAQEYEMQAEVNGLMCQFRIDRLDEIQAGKLAVIDYKTGKANPNEWCRDRMDSPQVPLYALAITAQLKPVEAVLFGLVRAGEHQYTGMAENSDLIPGIKPPEEHAGSTTIKQDLQSWAETFPLWQQRLGVLASQHLAGEAAVDPKNNLSCQYCELASLCRIDQPIKPKVAA